MKLALQHFYSVVAATQEGRDIGSYIGAYDSHWPQKIPSWAGTVVKATERTTNGTFLSWLIEMNSCRMPLFGAEQEAAVKTSF